MTMIMEMITMKMMVYDQSANYAHGTTLTGTLFPLASLQHNSIPNITTHCVETNFLRKLMILISWHTATAATYINQNVANFGWYEVSS